MNADGTKLISENKVLNRWAAHFEGVLNKPPINNKAIERLLQVPVNKSFDVTPILEDIQIAIH